MQCRKKEAPFLLDKLFLSEASVAKNKMVKMRPAGQRKTSAGRRRGQGICHFAQQKVSDRDMNFVVVASQYTLPYFLAKRKCFSDQTAIKIVFSQH